MSEPALNPAPPLPAPAPSSEQTLRKLFLTLFLRGRSARGLQKQGVPQSVWSKLGLVLFFYAFTGFFALLFIGQPVFALALYLHAMTLVFLGMFLAASSGEVLFNKEEADILLHRPVTPKALLWAKIGVLVRVALWLAGAFNLAGFFAGIAASDGGWLFPLAHVMSTVLEALFCAGSVVLVYQLCLRWFGRERLDGLMTMAQVMVAVVAVLAGQIPQLLGRFHGKLHFNFHSWWVCLLPPAWFAGLDDSIAGSRSATSAILAVVGIIATAAVLWLAFEKLARDYESGLQAMGETAAPKRPRGERRRWLDTLAGLPPLRWWLRDPVSRASFLLVAAYLLRDRDVKLRVYPGLAPMLVWPVIMFVQEHGPRQPGGFSGFSGFVFAFTGIYIGIIPLLALDLLRYSQQWQAADLFRVVPMKGPGALCDGARHAVLVILTLPVVVALALLARLMGSGNSHLPLLLPGIIALPVYAMLACLGGNVVPLSLPSEEAKSAGRGVKMIGVMMVSALLALVATLSWNYGWFKWLLLVEAILAVGLYLAMRASVGRSRWTSLE
jgi:ABC-2 type transport system permease protein